MSVDDETNMPVEDDEEAFRAWALPYVEASTQADPSTTNAFNRKPTWKYEPPEIAEQILPPTAEEIEAIREAAHAEGFSQGHNEGHAQGAEIAAKELTDSTAALIIAEDPRGALAQTASLWFGAHPETVIAVTGTNGKTSVSTFARQIWIEMDLAAVNLGTTGVEGVWTHPLKHTTPEPITLHRALAQARGEGVTHVAMEASSHGLDQRLCKKQS